MIKTISDEYVYKKEVDWSLFINCTPCQGHFELV